MRACLFFPVLLACGCAASNGIITRGANPAEALEYDHLGAAAKLVESGREPAAIPHLKAHLRSAPHSHATRAFLAEMLYKIGQDSEAQKQFERCLREAEPAHEHRKHAHTRLMELAVENGDEFAEEWHRGAALVLLVQSWKVSGEPDSEKMIEPTLAKAVDALNRSRTLNPADPRPLLALHEAYCVWEQPHSARRIAGELQLALSDPVWSDAECERIAELLNR